MTTVIITLIGWAYYYLLKIDSSPCNSVVACCLEVTFHQFLYRALCGRMLCIGGAVPELLGSG
jgi:hypothetical protein